jgi:hypothetical protein
MLAACGSVTEKPDPDPDPKPDPVSQVVVERLATLNRNVDVLFVIDDSPSTLDKQLNVKNNFPRFIEVLNTIQGGLPDVHIGVVSSDLGTKGTQDAAAGPAIGQIGNGGCSGTGKNGNLQVGMAAADLQNGALYISDIKQSDGSRLKNYTGDLATVFGKLATLGAGGCGFEQHLFAMRRALDNNPANATFLRPDAALAVIFLADEDDCTFSRSTLLGPESPSLGPLQSFRCNRFGHTCAIGGRTEAEMNQVGVKDQCGPNESSQYLENVALFVNFLKGLKSDPNKIVVAGIMGAIAPYAVELRAPPGGGTPQPGVAHSCSYQGTAGLEVADPPIRLKYFLDQFPGRSVFTTVCQQDLSGGLQQVANLIRQSIERSCVSYRLADIDPRTPNLQVDCTVEDVVFGISTPIPSCEGALDVQPCWRLEIDPVTCSFAPAPNFKLVVQRAVAPDPSTLTRMRCLVEI